MITFEYDAVGNLLTATDSLTGTVARSYDALNRLVSEISPQGAITYAYDQASRRQTMQANGLPPVSYGYDANSRLTGLVQGPQAASLSYDPSNRRTRLELPNGIVITYSYDDASRPTSQTYTGPSGVLGDLSYHYDANGNRVGTGGAFARSLIPTAVPSTTYDQANQQLAFGDVTQTFDNNGNLLTQTDASGTTTYTWDARNRLAAISGPTVSASFAYDPFGRRTSKAINGQTMTFHYDAVDIVRESGEAGDASYLRTLTIDEALSRTDTSGLVTYLADILGSTVALADANGTPATDYTYEPFGRTSVSGVPSLNPFRFTGRENDGNGLYYYRARYYDPIRSQFLSEDPLGLAGGLNLFAYVAGNPVNFGDPSGLRIWVCNRRAEFPPMANHAYLWDDRPGITVRSCGRGSNSEREKGPAVDVCVPAPYSQSHEDEIMRCCRETANQGPWIPGRNDCHTSVERCLDKAGIPPTPAPGGRVGPICPPGPCPSEPED